MNANIYQSFDFRKDYKTMWPLPLREVLTNGAGDCVSLLDYLGKYLIGKAILYSLPRR